MLTSLASIAIVDMHLYGREYWVNGSGKALSQSIWWKHGILGVYSMVFVLGLTVSRSFHFGVGYCRVLLYLTVHRRTMLVVTQVRHILGAVMEIWVLIFINIMLFAWMGMVLFAGTLEGSSVFPDIMESGWRLFVLFTTTNFPEIMMIALDNVRATLIYFAAFVILNVFFLAPLSLAFIFNVFRGGQKGIPRLEEEIRAESTAMAFSLLDDRSTGYVEMATVGAFLLEVYALRGIACRELARLQDLMEEAAVRTPEQASLNLNDFKDAVRVMDRSLRHAEWVTEVQWYMPNLYGTKSFQRLNRIVKHQRVTLWPGVGGTRRWTVLFMDLLEAILLVISFMALFIATGIRHGPQVHFDWIQLGVVFGFCVTTTLAAVVRGWHNCLQRPAWVFNLIVTTVSVLEILVSWTPYGVGWGWRVMRALRILHLSLSVAFMPRLGSLVRMLLIMTKRAVTPASVLFAWAFLMAVMGVQLFGGTVCLPAFAQGMESCAGAVITNNTYTQTNLALLNFNDVPTAFVTLFVLFVVNDWYVIVDEFVATTGTGWARAFFIVNYIIGVAVILNLVVTVVINSFWDEYKRTVKPTSTLRSLHDAAAHSAHPAAATDISTNSPSWRIGPNREEPADESGTGATSHSTTDEGKWGQDDAFDSPRSHRIGARMAWEGTGAEARTGPVQGMGMGGNARAIGDQQGMEAERAMTSRASQRRLAISGIT